MGISDFVTVTPKFKNFQKNHFIFTIFLFSKMAKICNFCRKKNFGNLMRYVTKGYGVFQFVMGRYILSYIELKLIIIISSFRLSDLVF